MKTRTRVIASVGIVALALSVDLTLIALSGTPLLLAAVQPAPEAGTILTIAGSGPPGVENAAYAGDGGPATQARLAVPWGVTVDAADNVLISDQWNFRVREVSPEGTITTIVGSGPIGQGKGGYAGDGGLATEAWLNDPKFVALDRAGNLFIAEDGNSRVRKVSPDGIITTVAGKEPFSFGGDGGPATEAGLSGVYALTLDAASNLYIADGDNHRVRKVDTNGIITTIAGTGPSRNSEVGSFSGDGGPATEARLNNPRGLVVDQAGNLFIADMLNHRIRKVDTNGIITTVAGRGARGWGGGTFRGDGGPATEARMNLPVGLDVDSAGNLFIGDLWNHRVRKVDTNGIITTVAGRGATGSGNGGFSGDGGPASQARLHNPHQVVVDRAGNLLIADLVNNRIRKVYGVAAPGLFAGLPYP